jgi:Dual OB-containing domain
VPVKEVLVLAVTKMLGGVCIAGMTAEPDPVTGLRWVRPVREHSHVLLGDITTPGGMVLRPFDVVEFDLLSSHPSPPHTEDWITDFVHQRPRVVRRLEGERRAGFLRTHLDTAPHEVLEGQQRSLCLVKPDWIQGRFHLDAYSGEFEARLAFGLGNESYRGSLAKGGISVSDLRWRALGRGWLAEGEDSISFDAGALERSFGIQEIYLAVGLTRSYEGHCWPLIVGVHTQPDYTAVVDYQNM